MTELEELILETLSFYDPIIDEHMILQMDDERLKMLPNLTNEDLKETLKDMERRKLIKRTKVGKDDAWIKLFPKKSLFRRLRDFFN